MTDKTKSNNWLQRHWIISVVLGFLLFIFVVGLFVDEGNLEDYEKIDKNVKEYTDKDLNTLIALFADRNSPYTDIQKEENFKQYGGKWIRASGWVKDVDEIMLSSNFAVRLINFDNEYAIGATAYFGKEEKEGLLKFETYEEIKFEGRIEQYNSLLGVIIKEAKLIQ